MRFGLQKMTLLDFPGKVSCTVFTSGCNFRCPFCHNGSLVRTDDEENMALSQEELLDFLQKRVGVLEGVCITGGEPLLHRELFDFLAEVRAMDYPVKLDTNGTFPDRLRYAVENGMVNYVAMDIKNSPAKYMATAGITNSKLMDAVKASVEYLKQGNVPFEFRTTVVRTLHVPEDFAEIGQWIQGVPRYFLQKFVDSGDVLGNAEAMGALSDEEMQRCLDAVRQFVPAAELRGVK